MSWFLHSLFSVEKRGTNKSSQRVNKSITIVRFNSQLTYSRFIDGVRESETDIELDGEFVFVWRGYLQGNRVHHDVASVEKSADCIGLGDIDIC